MAPGAVWRAIERGKKTVMEKPEDRSLQARCERKSPWEHPTVTLAGTISLLVRMGSAHGKGANSADGDGGQFQTCNPAQDPLCR